MRKDISSAFCSTFYYFIFFDCISNSCTGNCWFCSNTFSIEFRSRRCSRKQSCNRRRSRKESLQRDFAAARTLRISVFQVRFVSLLRVRLLLSTKTFPLSDTRNRSDVSRVQRVRAKIIRSARSRCSPVCSLIIWRKRKIFPSIEISYLSYFGLYFNTFGL